KSRLAARRTPIAARRKPRERAPVRCGPGRAGHQRPPAASTSLYMMVLRSTPDGRWQLKLRVALAVPLSTPFQVSQALPAAGSTMLPAVYVGASAVPATSWHWTVTGGASPIIAKRALTDAPPGGAAESAGSEHDTKTDGPPWLVMPIGRLRSVVSKTGSGASHTAVALTRCTRSVAALAAGACSIAKSPRAQLAAADMRQGKDMGMNRFSMAGTAQSRPAESVWV